MAWQDGYQQGEFRGVPFFLKSHTFTGGRRITSHEFPGRDNPFNEDTGRAKRGFQFTAYVLGDDYFTQRENLIAALETEGPGRLVHPYRGVFQVVVASFSETEDTDNGRMASFDITFSEDVPEALTVTTKNTFREVTDAGANLLAAVQDDFVDKYPEVFFLARVLSTVKAGAQAAINGIDDAKNSVAQVAEYRRQAENILGKVNELILDAVSLAKDIIGLANWGMSVYSGQTFKPTEATARQQFDEMRAIIATMSAPSDIPSTGTGGETAELIRQLAAAAATGSAVGIVASIPFSSVEDADTVRAQVFDMLDTLQGSATVSDAVFEAAASAKQAISEDLDRRILGLSVVIEYQTPESEPVLAVSQEIYGDIGHSDEIVARNSIRHPGFCPASRPLKVQV